MMKNLYLFLCAVLFVSMLTLPLMAVKPPGLPPISDAGTNPGTQPPKTETPDVFKVLEADGKKVVTLSELDYIFGVVACEMPATYHEEALKAQAVAAYTLACRERIARRESPGDGLKGADFSGDPDKFQGYLNNGQVREKFGDQYEDYSAKISAAVTAVEGQVLICRDELVLAAYHAISPGRTESAKNAWGSGPEYLKPVLSAGDLLAPEYQTENKFTKKEIRQAFAEFNIIFSKKPSDWFSEPEYTESGIVSGISLCGVALTGQEVRSALGLRSASFDVDLEDGKFVFTVRGYGHGVGMSQNGANYMAGQGFSYKEILGWYYPDCKLEKL